MGFLVLLGLVGNAAAADAPSPQPLPPGITVPIYSLVHNPFHPGQKLVYRASWVGIPAATATLELKSAPGQREWIAEARITSSKLVDLLFKMRDYLREDIDPSSLRARDMFIIQHENKRLNEYQVDFDRTRKMVQLIKRNRNKQVTESHQFISENPAAPISGSLLALSQPADPSRPLVFDVFSGSTRYVIQFRIEGREHISVPAGEFDAWRVKPDILYISNQSILKKARDTTVWVSADERHLPLRVTAAAFIGSVRADLVQAVDETAPMTAKR